MSTSAGYVSAAQAKTWREKAWRVRAAPTAQAKAWHVQAASTAHAGEGLARASSINSARRRRPGACKQHRQRRQRPGACKQFKRETQHRMLQRAGTDSTRGPFIAQWRALGCTGRTSSTGFRRQPNVDFTFKRDRARTCPSSLYLVVSVSHAYYIELVTSITHILQIDHID